MTLSLRILEQGKHGGDADYDRRAEYERELKKHPAAMVRAVNIRGDQVIDESREARKRAVAARRELWL